MKPNSLAPKKSTLFSEEAIQFSSKKPAHFSMKKVEKPILFSTNKPTNISEEGRTV